MATPLGEKKYNSEAKMYYYSNYPHLFIKDDSVKMEQLDFSVMKDALDILEQLAIKENIRGFIITSAYRTSSVNASVKGASASKHLVGRALDISPTEAITGKTIITSNNDLYYNIVRNLYHKPPELIYNPENPEVPIQKNSNELWFGETAWHTWGTGPHVHIGYKIGKAPKSSEINEPWQQPDPETTKLISRPKPIVYIHKDENITSLEELVDFHTVFQPYKGNIEELENYLGATDKTNKERIEESYTKVENGTWFYSTPKGLIKEEYPLLKTGTILYLDPGKITWEAVARKGDNQIIDMPSFPIFIAEARKKLEENDYYVPTIKTTGSRFQSHVHYINNFVTVWIYCKALNKIVDVTDFCKNVMTSTDMSNSDGFSLSLAFFEDILNDSKNKEWGLGGRYQNEVMSSNVGFDLSYLFKHITCNDIVWIKYEELECELINHSGYDRYNSGYDREVPPTNLPNQIYDMIGLVDIVNQTQNVGQGSGNVIVQGRSLIKLFQDDEAIFIPAGVMTDTKTGNMIIGPADKDDLLKRNFIDGEYHYMYGRNFRSVEDSLMFVLNQISNLGNVPAKDAETLFAAYGDRRTKKYKLRSGGSKFDSILETGVLANGVHQIIKLAIDESAKNRHLADASITNPNGNVLSLVNKICQPPLVEFCADTYGDTFNLTVRKPPFDMKGILSFLEGTYDGKSKMLTVDVSDVKQENLQWNTDFYTWYDFELRGGIFAESQKLRTPYVYFPEYVDLWGSKKCTVLSNYVRTDQYGYNFEDEIPQVTADLIYLIESTIYLPFTRTGTLVLNKGDRRFKKGTWIKYEKTNEIFYVHGVVNNASTNLSSISRQTTLLVSRGMVDMFVIDPENSTMPSYFNIVNLKKLKEVIQSYTREVRTSITREMLVNIPVFEFFKQRRQFISSSGDSIR